MQVPNTTSTTQVSKQFERAQFTVDQTRHTFAVLTHGLYSNKIRAIIRELACNAIDAHQMADKQDAPFDLFLPNRVKPWFKIRDYGTGLSHDDVMNLYRTVMRSTKQESNDQIGCFGLGSKSPFAYTDNFTVISYYNGEKRTYSMILGTEGIPEVISVSKVNSDEPNGLEISFPVDSEDFYTFEQEAREVLRPFPVQPTLYGKSNFEPDTYKEPHLDGEGWFLYRKTRNANSTAVMGNVEYPIEVQSKFSPVVKKLLKCVDLVYFFPIGTFAVTPSRENISWTDASINNVNQIFEDLYEEILSVFQEKLSGCKTFWEASHYGIESYVSLGGLIDDCLTWHGRKIPRNFDFFPKHLQKVAKELSVSYSFSKDSYSVSTTSCLTARDLSADTEFYLSDCKSAPYHLRRYLRFHGANKSRVSSVLLVPETAREYREILSVLGISAKQVKSVASLPRPPKKKSKSTRKSTKAVQVYRVTSDKVEESDVDVSNDSGCYVKLYRNQIEVEDSDGTIICYMTLENVRDYLDDLKNNGVVPKDFSFVVVRSSRLGKFEKSKNWKLLGPVLKKAVWDRWTSPDMEWARKSLVYCNKRRSMIRSEGFDTGCFPETDHLLKIRDYIESSDMVEAAPRFYSIASDLEEINNNHNTALRMEFLQKMFGNRELVGEVTPFLEGSIVGMFPLLKYFRVSWRDSEVSDYMHYVIEREAGM